MVLSLERLFELIYKGPVSHNSYINIIVRGWRLPNSSRCFSVSAAEPATRISKLIANYPFGHFLLAVAVYVHQRYVGLEKVGAILYELQDFIQYLWVLLVVVSERLSLFRRKLRKLNGGKPPSQVVPGGLVVGRQPNFFEHVIELERKLLIAGMGVLHKKVTVCPSSVVHDIFVDPPLYQLPLRLEQIEGLT